MSFAACGADFVGRHFAGNFCARAKARIHQPSLDESDQNRPVIIKVLGLDANLVVPVESQPRQVIKDRR